MMCMLHLFTVKNGQVLQCMLTISMVFAVFPGDLFAADSPDISDPNQSAMAVAQDSPDPNTPELPPESTERQDPNRPSVSTDSADIEELLVESQGTVDLKVLRQYEEKKAVQKASKKAKREKEQQIPIAVESETSKTADKKPPVIPEKTIPAGVDSEDTSQHDSDDVEELIEEVETTPRQRFEDEYIQKMLAPYSNFKKRLYDKHRISLATEQVAIYQRATGGRRPREQTIYNFSIFGLWDLSKTDTEDRGAIGFLFEERDNVTAWNVEDFSRKVGSTFRTHTLNSSERSRTSVRQLWWRKRFVDDSITLTIGKIHHSSYYNRNAYAGSSRTHFLGSSFARNPNRILPQDGLGVNINIRPNNSYYISMGIGDARSDLNTSGFDTIQEGDAVEMLEFGLTPEKSNYRFTVWRTDKTVIDDIVSEEGAGVAFSFDHELHKRVGVFGRYGYTEEQVADMRNFVSAGFVVQDPWSIKGDLFGCGVSWDENADTDEDEWAFEVFHRMQATKMLQLTPSILVIFDPTRSDETDPVAVFGLRARMLF